ncbi:MAG: hypothetical protein U5K76_06470 [Woeseiaceae bacterium]|nr:hypothetical protein [Woeseiaceae bacterium]
MRNPMSKLAILLLAFCSAGASAQSTEIKIATLAPENSEWMSKFRAGAREIRERTDDRAAPEVLQLRRRSGERRARC